jgi:phosphoglycolate phosphatase
MLEGLGLVIDYEKEVPGDIDLLLTVDCQRGASNVQNFDLPEGTAVAVIDHHRPEIQENETTMIRPYLASCATLVWHLLEQEKYEMEPRILTALYYGLFTDTNGLSELRHPLDRDLADIPNDTGLIRKLKNSAISADELDIVADALASREQIGSIGLFKAKPCDANLLGFTSDIAQQVATLDCCVVYCVQPYGVKLSIRSSAREIMASEIAAYLCKEAGNGGGSIEKAGGFMSFKGIKEVSGGQEPEEYLKARIQAYISHYDLIYADNHQLDFGSFSLYRKIPEHVGFAKTTEIFPEGSKITVRTLEGDVDTTTAENLYLMIGVQGEVYPIKQERFEKSYQVLDETYQPVSEYVPAILDRQSGVRKEILPFVRTCVPKGDKLARAVLLERDTKVFTSWDLEKYFFGGAGDYLVANEGVYDDCYIVRGDIFLDTYEKVAS